MFGFGRSRKVKFVAASPSLADRLIQVRNALRQGRILWILLLPWIVITAPLRVVGHGLVAFGLGGRMAGESLQSRQIRHLLLGLPSVLATLGVLVIGGVVLGREDNLRGIYNEAARDAFRAEKYATARLYFERLFQLDHGSAETRYFLGLALDHFGKETAAMQMVSAVAQGQAGGYAPANAWVAATLMANDVARRQPEIRATIYRNLLKANKGMPENLQVKLNLARYHKRGGNFLKAIPYLEAAAEIDPFVNLKLARFYVQDGRLQSARTVLNRAEEYLRGQLDHHPLDQHTRIGLAKALTMQGEFQKVLTVLETGRALNPSPAYRRMVAEAHVALHDQILREVDPDYGRMLRHLRQALQADPGMPAAIKRLVNLGEIATRTGKGTENGAADPKTAESAKGMLRSMLARGEHLLAVHMALGLKAWRDGDFDGARRHFQSAYDIAPSAVQIANNLAWILAHQKKPQPKRALEIINTVIERHPRNRHYRDTRGEIYLALEQWDRAIADLEFALPAMADNPRIHLSLATAYAARGQDKLARAHRREAERLTNPQAPQRSAK